MGDNKIFNFDKVILREPTLPFSNFFKIPKKEKDIVSFVKELFNDSLFKEGIFLASPELYHEWEKFYNGHNNKEEKIVRSILKYYIRVTSNPVPFGLFSTYSILQPNSDNNNTNISYSRFSSLDMTFLMKLIHTMNKRQEIKSKLKYFPNNTCYALGDEIRYIEVIENNSDINFKLSTVNKDEVLSFVLKETDKGLSLKELHNVLLDNLEGVEKEEIDEYIEELIRSQIITSSLDICLNHESPLKQLILFFEENFMKEPNEYINTVFNLLNELDKGLMYLDNAPKYNDISKYKKIISVAQKSELEFNPKYLINTNLKKNVEKKAPFLFQKDLKKINKAIQILSLFTPKTFLNKYVPNRNLKKFIEAYMKRYEARQMPLLSVLDNVTGIGYIQDENDFNSFSNVIDDIDFNEIENPNNEQQFSSNKDIDGFWFDAILKAHRNHATEIDLKLENLDDLREKKNTKDFSGTFSVLYSKVKDTISIMSVGSTTALHYIGRFTSSDDEIKKFANEITEAEKRIFSDKLLAEIIHLPAYRAGNISIRNVDRDCEIPILSKSSSTTKTVLLKDILISIDDGNIKLKDKNQREIIPFLSCAQNYHRDTLPVYHFLCDLQSQYRSNILDLHLNNLFYQYFSYIPRIKYGDDIILFLARWSIRYSEFNDFKKKSSEVDSNYIFKEFLQKLKIPNLITLLENNREPIVLDIENPYMVNWLLEELEKKKKIIITEFISDYKTNSFCNEYLMSFYCKPEPSDTKINIKYDDIKRSFSPCDEWVYFKIFTGINIANKILISKVDRIIEELKNNGIIDKWFFIRYKDPDFHLRIRLHLKNDKEKGKVINMFNNYFKDLISNDLVWKLDISTYEREVERYYGKFIEETETVFSEDSTMVLKLLKSLKKDNREDDLWLYCLKSIDAYFELFNFSLEEKYLMLDAMYKNISIEFNSNKTIRAQIDKKFRKEYNRICEIILKEDLYSSLIDKRNIALKNTIYSRLIKEPDFIIKDLISNYIHMTVNRFITANSGMHELVFYGLLEKYYKKEKGLKKYKSF
ncbi:lantibiotic dehydratase [Tenacibaculum sp. TC6]|uniref:lantibiotic dehydratase n=1 Tax=Tenacibaculum sp. TC6 TaxID=3423223 RepID=UPI003D36C286